MKEFDLDVGFEKNISFKKTRKEEYLNIDETLAELERSSSIIRLEMNSIELPLFSKDSRRVKDQIKVYHFMIFKLYQRRYSPQHKFLFG